MFRSLTHANTVTGIAPLPGRAASGAKPYPPLWCAVSVHVSTDKNRTAVKRLLLTQTNRVKSKQTARQPAYRRRCLKFQQRTPDMSFEIVTEETSIRSQTGGSTSSMARKALLSSTVGATLEWYEFFIYGLAAALVFGKQFFPSSDPTTGTLLALSTFAVAFVARPIGGVIFGHLGDRIGRKSTLIITLSLMGGATVAIGLLPTYAVAGVWAPVLLVTVRLIQGLSLGGEFAGSILMGVEYGGAKRRGLFGGIVNSGLAWGLLLANLVFLAVSMLPGESFDSWGWRIPFILSAGLLAVGLFIRLSVAESPDFQKVKTSGEVHRTPIIDVLKNHWRAVLSAMATFLCAGCVFYVATVFSLSYATSKLELSRPSVLAALLVSTGLMGVMIPIFGGLSDRVGRRPIIIGSTVAMGIAPFLWLPSSNDQNLWIPGGRTFPDDDL
uniref:Major facilitator superfamily (MFS) profile domain-containing protein n=1 Tax=Rhodococcus sp. NS1 TaxID=402236 RepID=A0A097SPW4_9NOCA|nr:hypothetical protein LRS1606.134 [Rhodococcus sp. NS1]